MNSFPKLHILTSSTHVVVPPTEDVRRGGEEETQGAIVEIKYPCLGAISLSSVSYIITTSLL